MKKAIGTLLLSALALSTGPAAEAQDKKKPRIDPQKVTEAIRKGVEFLKKSGIPGSPYGGTAGELILLTYLHAGVAEDDPAFQAPLQDMLQKEPRFTYNVALQAMALEELDRVKYQTRIAQCAQFLVDNQSDNGNWHYGNPTQYPEHVPVPAGRPEVKTAPARKAKDLARREKPRVVSKIEIRKQRDGERGDSSNSQYAALGLRACHDAGIVLPGEVLERGEKWWRLSQCPEEGKREAYPARGWYYKAEDKPAYGSMTAGAVGSLCIYAYLQSKPWKTDKEVMSGFAWLSKHFTLTENPGLKEPEASKTWLYYLYALERAGMLYGTDHIGAHDWYAEGTKMLLECQKPDGSWRPNPMDPPSWSQPVWDTCWAILFLRRTTAPLADVASLDRRLK